MTSPTPEDFAARLKREVESVGRVVKRAGIQAVETGAAQVGMSSRNLLDDEKSLISIPIIYDAIAVVGGLVLYAVFVMWAHAKLIGVAPFP